MIKIEKEDVIDAFKNRKGKRNFLLYIYYQNEYFNDKLPADLIARKISKDLGIEIKRDVIYHIFKRYLKKDSKNINTNEIKQKHNYVRKSEENVNKSFVSGKEVGKDKSVESGEEVQPKKSKWTNADDLPDDPFNGAFDDWKKK